MPLRTYLLNRQNNTKCRLNGVKPSARLPSDQNLCTPFSEHIVLSTAQLPPKVDLRPDMTPIENQSSIGSCAANTLAGAYEYILKKANGENIDVSRLFIYYTARTKKKDVKKITDSGCAMTNAIEALHEAGTCLESVWPYDVAQVNTRPNDDSFAQATGHQITSALKVNINLNEMKTCLAQGFPFAFGLRLFKTFDKAAKGGIVPIPDSSAEGRTEHGRHAMLAVGYSDQSKSFIIRNSWGEQWGDKGYCYIPYDYMSNPKLCFDAWTVRKLEVDDMGHDHWDNDDNVNLYDETQLGEEGDDDLGIERVEEDDDNEDDENTSSSSDNDGEH